jgi:hypothetical protein
MSVYDDEDDDDDVDDDRLCGRGAGVKVVGYRWP